MVTAQMVKDLREKTGAGMMDCKKALAETNGDLAAAEEFLREKGIAKANKKESRIAAEGLAAIYAEDKKEVIERIHEAAKYIPLDRLCLSPQCGFASCEIGNKLTEEQQWAKLKLVKEIAEEVWG